jgi:hypothetical protein
MVSTFNTGSTGAPELRAGHKVAILRLPSLDGYATQTVLHYFNHPYFFDNEAMRAGFMNSIPILNEETKNLLTVTLDDFFQTAWAKELAGGERDMVLFLTKTIYGCKGVAVLEAYSVWKIKVPIKYHENPVRRTSKTEGQTCWGAPHFRHWHKPAKPNLNL